MYVMLQIESKSRLKWIVIQLVVDEQILTETHISLGHASLWETGIFTVKNQYPRQNMKFKWPHR